MCVEPAPRGRGGPGLYVRDPGAGVRGDGEAPRRHAGDDPVQREEPAPRTPHQVPRDTGQ